ncbi:MAG: pyridoxamine 5'-phosphate oxidase family protein [Pseudomonadota bacterium]
MLIDTTEALEEVIGVKPPTLDMKVIDHIDATAQKWLKHSRLMIATVGTAHGPRMLLAGGKPGFSAGAGHTLELPHDSLDDLTDIAPGAAFGSLWVVPGMRETLRLNGQVTASASGQIKIAIQECYLHCAKALIRSDFWAAKSNAAALDNDGLFIDKTRFMALGTISANNEADLSPKGDPAGKLVQSQDERLLFPDRPGNRRTDSFLNILTQPTIAAALIVPGYAEVLLVQGRARLSKNEESRARFEVDGRIPNLVVELRDLHLERRPSVAIANAELWKNSPAQPPEGLNPAKIFAAHMRLSKQKSIGAKIAKVVVSVPGFMQRGLDRDYDTNLY